MKTVHELRKLGYKVRVHHNKEYQLMSDAGRKIICKGASFVDVTEPNGRTACGDAFCKTVDQFNRKLGLRIALGRALKQLGLETK